MREIPIFFASNDDYIPYVSVMMQSIMENAQNGRNYDFYILHRDIKPESMGKLQSQVSNFLGFSLSFIDMSPYVKDYNFFVSWHITIETYFRLFIPYIFPNMGKVLYLDGDMVCLADISELFNIEISDNFIAGVSDAGLCLHYVPKHKMDKTRKILAKRFEVLLNMENPENYINAGMLLINCNKFREVYTMQQIIDTITSRKWKYHDQDVINVLAKNKTQRLHKSWNYLPDMISKRNISVYDEESSCWTYVPEIYSKYVPKEMLAEYLQAQRQPKIIHFKPYAVWHYIQHFDEFWKYATRTPFCKEIVGQINKDGIIGKGLEDKIYFTIRTRTGFGGIAILKSIIAFFTRRIRLKNC